MEPRRPACGGTSAGEPAQATEFFDSIDGKIDTNKERWEQAMKRRIEHRIQARAAAGTDHARGEGAGDGAARLRHCPDGKGLSSRHRTTPYLDERG